MPSIYLVTESVADMIVHTVLISIIYLYSYLYIHTNTYIYIDIDIYIYIHFSMCFCFELLTLSWATAAMAINQYCRGLSLPVASRSFASLLHRSGISAAILVGRSQNKVTG